MNIHKSTIAVASVLLLLAAGTFAGTGEKAPPLKTDTVNFVPQGAAPVSQASRVTATGEEINWQVISGGGNTGSSSSYVLGGTVGQTAVGTGGSTNFGLRHGFWQSSGVVPCDCHPGDPNADAATNVGDAVYIINFIFKGGPAPTPYATCSGDANGDCAVNVGDAVYQINYIFKGGPAPVTCDQWRTACGSLREE